MIDTVVVTLPVEVIFAFNVEALAVVAMGLAVVVLATLLGLAVCDVEVVTGAKVEFPTSPVVVLLLMTLPVVVVDLVVVALLLTAVVLATELVWSALVPLTVVCASCVEDSLCGVVDCVVVSLVVVAFSTSIHPPASTLHRRLGHPSDEKR